MKIEIPDRLVKETNRIFHEEEAKLYDERHPEVERERENWDSVLSKYLPHTHESLTVLDIGTGTGFVPSVVDKYLNNSLMICIDISKQMLLTARIKLNGLKNHFKFITCDAETLPFKDSSIDIITINSTLHHIPNYENMLEETNRVLSRRGILFIMHEPNKLFYNSSVSKINLILQLCLSLKAKLMRSQSQKIQRTILFEDVNRRLVNERVIAESLAPRQVQTLVDIHSPTASGTPNRSKGFVPKDIASQLRGLHVLEMKTYNYLGKTDPKTDILCFILNCLLTKIFKEKGYMFCIVLGKL